MFAISSVASPTALDVITDFMVGEETIDLVGKPFFSVNGRDLDGDALVTLASSEGRQQVLFEDVLFGDIEDQFAL